MRFFRPILLLFSIFVSACGAATAEVPPNSVPTLSAVNPAIHPAASLPSSEASATKPPVKEEGIIVPEEILEKTITDLIERLHIPKDQIRQVDAKAVNWPDASLGCPQPGVAYMQVTTPGYRIVLEASGNQYTYHTDVETQVVLCQESLPIIPVKPGEIDDAKPWMPIEPIQPGFETPRP